MTVIPGYTGAKLGTDKKYKPYGATTNMEHIKLALGWLVRKINISQPDPRDPCPVTEAQIKARFGSDISMIDINEKDWTNWKDNSTRKVTFPLKKLNSSITEWMDHLGVSVSSFRLDPDIFDSIAYVKPAKTWRPMITISSRCLCLAVVRYAIFHELCELRIASKYGVTRHDVLSKPGNGCHQLVCIKDDAFDFFESQNETRVKEKNFKSCMGDLGTICSDLEEKGGVEYNQRLYNECKNLLEYMPTFDGTGYTNCIPGYCEIYEFYKYRDPKYSSIAWMFTAANLLGIRLPR